MSTDFRALCAELLGALENEGHAHWPGGPDGDPLIEQARAALAAEPDGPAVPDGREPASVVGEPSDEELLATLDQAVADFPPRHPEAEDLNAVEYPLALELRKARAVLARFGSSAYNEGVPSNHMPTLNIIMQLADDYFTFRGNSHGDSFFATSIEANKDPAQSIYEFARAAISRYGHQPAPPVEGEVGELVEWLRDRAESTSLAHNALRITRAADLLEQRHPTPVPVTERLPGPEDCDAEGKCWMGYWDSHVNGLGHSHKTWFWTLEDLSMVDEHTHWLPHHALPLPQGEVQP